MHNTNTYWAVIASNDPKKDGKEIEVIVGSRIKGCRFYDIEPMRLEAEHNEVFWYKRVFETKLINVDDRLS